MAVLGTYLVVKCEKCGKKYGTTPEKLKKKEVTFPCKECGTTVTATRPDEIPDQGKEKKQVSLMPDRVEKGPGRSFLNLGLTAKFLLFTILPLIIISVAVIFITDSRMRSLQRQTIDSSTMVVRKISQDLIAQISETVARQTRQYLFSHPDLRKEKFNTDIYFKKVVLQKIGLTGSTSLYEIAGDKGAWITWTDADPTLVGEDMKTMHDQLGNHFQQYWDIVTGVKSGEISSGVYMWPDARGNLRKKYAVCTPIEGTPFVISASIFMDEITAPLQTIEAKGHEVARQIRRTLMIILGGGLLLIFSVLLLFGRSLTGKIKRLAEWTDAISLGHFDSQPVNLDSRDEIGDLVKAIDRMQQSIKISIARLSKRRG